jgi:hypothetical protein
MCGKYLDRILLLRRSAWYWSIVSVVPKRYVLLDYYLYAPEPKLVLPLFLFCTGLRVSAYCFKSTVGSQGVRCDARERSFLDSKWPIGLKTSRSSHVHRGLWPVTKCIGCSVHTRDPWLNLWSNWNSIRYFSQPHTIAGALLRWYHATTYHH